MSSFPESLQTMNGRGKGDRSVPVQSSEGFIQQIDLGFLGPRASEKGALLLPSREGFDLPVGKGFQICHLKSFIDDGLIASGKGFQIPSTE